ncbi:hypothetical protein GCM10027063_01570 [Promicromonospora xylanilytica]
MPIRRAPRTTLAACAALAVLLTVSGCDLVERSARADDPDQPTATAERSPASPEQPGTSGDDRPEPHTSTVTLDGAVLRVDSRKAAVVQADGGVPGLQTVTLELTPGGTADLILTSPGELDVDSDGSITVLDGDGTPVAAIGPPAPPSGTEDGAPRIEVTDADATRARVEVDDRPARGSGTTDTPARTGPLTVTFEIGTDAIESATWGENEGGRSLAVDPRDWVRHAGEAGLDLIRAQLVAAEPDAGSRTMEHQLVCHAVGAPDKSTWNLEPWRPDVGLILTATAHCNPV